MSASSRARRAGALTAVLALLLCAFGLTLATGKVSNDVTSSSLGSWRIAQTGTPWLEDVDWQQYKGKFGLWIGDADNGHTVAFRSPGPVAAGVPAYVVARAVGVDGYSPVPGSIMAVLLTTMALALLYLAIRTRLEPRVAAPAVLALALTTPVWSVSADALWTHPVTLLGIAGMAWASARERWWLVGLFGGLALWGRLHTAVIVALLGLLLGWTRRRPAITVRIGLASAAWLGAAVLWSRWMYGTWSPAGGYSVEGYADRATETSGGLSSMVVNHLGLWVAPDRGILVWTPVILVVLPALVRSWRGLPDWSRHLLVGGIVYTLIQGQLNGFSGGSGFYGYRLTLELLVCAFPALALSLPGTGPVARALIGPLLGLQFSAFVLGASFEGMILFEDRAWRENSYVHMMVEMPVLLLWPALMMGLGALVGRVVQRRAVPQPAAVEAGDGGSDVGAGDELDRV